MNESIIIAAKIVWKKLEDIIFIRFYPRTLGDGNNRAMHSIVR